MDSISFSNPSPNPKSRIIYSDRFIPNRTGSDFSLFNVPFSSDNDNSTSHAALPRSTLFPLPPATPDISVNFGDRSISSSSSSTPSSSNRNIFRYKSEFNKFLSLSIKIEDYSPGVVDRKPEAPRRIPSLPYRVLDAPALQDDFHLNLLDWSLNNVVAVGLESCVYLWNACSSKVTKLCDLGVADSVCSVGWSQHGTHLAVGTDSGEVQIWDASRCQRIRTMKGHRLRTGTLAWSSSMLSLSSRDKSILQRDIHAQEDYISKLTGHKLEVYGMKWSYDNWELASGGNDNRLFIWNQHSTQPVLKYCGHTVAVKAIPWSPHLHGLVTSGGGS